jgi:hypothetical protein
MKTLLRISLLLSLLMCCPWREVHPSTNQVQTLVLNPNSISSTFAQHTASPSALHVQDSNRVVVLNSLKLKNPNMALFYAVIPGVVFHGSGHVYAGKIPTAITLFGCELLGAGVAMLGALSQIEGPNETGENTVLIGSVIFWGTWIYDFVGSPLAVNSHNRKMLEQKAVGLELRTKDAEPRVIIVWRF